MRLRNTAKMRYRSATNEKGERFAVSTTLNGNMNFWHIVPGASRLYTFKAVQGKYDSGTYWSERLCKELLADLMSRQPSVQVMRFVVNGMVVFEESGSERAKTQPLPKEPEPLTEEEAAWARSREEHLIEEEKMFNGPAPYILYGKHPHSWKEYAWKLFPDTRMRQDIKPGDWVVVMTENGKSKVVTTRIEEAGDKEQPVKWVIHKITYRQKKRKKKEENTEEQTEVNAGDE